MKNALILSSAALMMVGCASLSSYQDARTLEQGKASFFVGAGNFSQTYKEQDTDIENDINDALEDWTMPLIEAGVRLGVYENLDFGLKYTLPGGINVDGKYQLVGGQEGMFGAASGLKFGYLNYKVNEAEYTTMDFTVPVYLTVYPTTWAALTVTPDFTFRTETATEGETETASIYGANTSLKLGTKYGVVAEYGIHMSDDESIDAYQQVGLMFYSPLELGLESLF